MNVEARLEMLLEELRQALPDPFHLRAGYEDFLRLSAARELLANRESSTECIIRFLGTNPDPALVRPAMLVLARFPELFYQRLLGIVERAGEKAGRVDTLKLALAAVAYCENSGRIGQEDAHDCMVVFGMRPEIMERIGIAPGNDLAGSHREFGHCTTPRSARMRHVPSSGICVQAGRLVSSYSIS